MKRRWPIAVLASVLILVSAAILVILLSLRTLEGAVPGRAPLLGLAVSAGRYLAASETGLFVSADGKAWSKPGRFSGRPALVTGTGPGGAAILSGGSLFLAHPAGEYRRLLPGRIEAVALGHAGDALYLVRNPRAFMVAEACFLAASPQADCEPRTAVRTISVRGGPDEILALDIAPLTKPLFFAGGLRAGVWRSSAPDRGWRRVLETATRAILVDERDPRKIYLGTAGGVLVSLDGGMGWSFTGMRAPVEALASGKDSVFALGRDRLVYESPDGQTWKALIAR